MSTPPPTFNEPVPIDYAPRPQDERNGVAVAALVLGILGLFACPLAGLVGLVLGIVGLVRASALPSHNGRGLAIGGICCSGVSLLLVPIMIAILLPSLARAREITKRAVCASNLSGIGQGMKVYAGDNLDWYPIAPFAKATITPGDASAVTFIGMMANNLLLPNATAQQSTVHPSRSLFLLVIDGTCTPKQFICPSSGDAEDDLRNRTGSTEVAAQPGSTRFDFRGYPYLSYGYQLPFGPHAQPNENLDSRVAIMADKGPFFQAGGTAAGFPWTTVDAIPAPPAPQANSVTSINIALASDMLKANSVTWRPYNSRNHSREGENVLYQDGHVSFEKKPICGVNYDNIYTVQGGYTLAQALLGKVPADKTGPLTQSDSVIVP